MPVKIATVGKMIVEKKDSALSRFIRWLSMSTEAHVPALVRESFAVKAIAQRRDVLAAHADRDWAIVVGPQHETSAGSPTGAHLQRG